MKTKQQHLIPPCWYARLRAADRRYEPVEAREKNTLECHSVEWAFCAVGESLYGAAGDPDRPDIDELPTDYQIQRAVETTAPIIARVGVKFSHAVKDSQWPYAIRTLREIQFMVGEKRRAILRRIAEYQASGKYRD